jgi:hypothetical protein
MGSGASSRGGDNRALHCEEEAPPGGVVRPSPEHSGRRGRRGQEPVLIGVEEWTLRVLDAATCAQIRQLDVVVDEGVEGGSRTPCAGAVTHGIGPTVAVRYRGSRTVELWDWSSGERLWLVALPAVARRLLRVGPQLAVGTSEGDVIRLDGAGQMVGRVVTPVAAGDLQAQLARRTRPLQGSIVQMVASRRWISASGGGRGSPSATAAVMVLDVVVGTRCGNRGEVGRFDAEGQLVGEVMMLNGEVSSLLRADGDTEELGGLPTGTMGSAGLVLAGTEQGELGWTGPEGGLTGQVPPLPVLCFPPRAQHRRPPDLTN